MTVRELATTFELSESMVYRILSEDLGKIWMYTRWVPHVIKFEKKFLAIVAVSTRGIHFFQVLDRGETVNSDVYIQFFQEMRTFYANLPQPLLMENIRLIHDNAQWDT